MLLVILLILLLVLMALVKYIFFKKEEHDMGQISLEHLARIRQDQAVHPNFQEDCTVISRLE
ncbi:MAG: hypothetical protein Q8R55_07435 [Candidatus Taylorbacteria bacterium]|nr:hypothetical protein [Candidatus Taylorbacteria bacterium]